MPAWLNETQVSLTISSPDAKDAYNPMECNSLVSFLNPFLNLVLSEPYTSKLRSVPRGDTLPGTRSPAVRFFSAQQSSRFSWVYPAS